jgi:Lauroyl/myristoyl acyltransferase
MRRGAALGRLAYRVGKRQRRFADRNLRLAYGDALTAAERDALTRRVFEHMGKNVFEFLRVPALSDAQVGERVAEVEGREWLEAVRARGGGFVVVTGHLGNFEFLGTWMAAQGVPSTGVAREPADPALADYLRRMRARGGNVLLSKGTSARELIGRLRRGEVITLGVDQNSGDVFVPFFGVPAGTVNGPARLALRTGVPLLPAFCVREPDDRYRVVFFPPILPEKAGDREAEVTRLTAQINDILEGMVRRYPDQWLWLHDRWRSAFEEKNIPRWPPGHDFDGALRRWRQAD